MIVILHGLFIGLLATVLIDVWALGLRVAFKLPTTNWAMVGRWFGHLSNGKFVHNAIADAAPVSGEVLAGWVIHYAIGLIYGVLYLWFMGDIVGQAPSLFSAIGFSAVLLLAPWFIMQPCLGQGIFARRAQNPSLVRSINISVHVVFGIGMYIGWRLLSQWIPFG